MARKGKRRRDNLLEREYERTHRLKIQHAAELRELRGGPVARDAEERPEAKAVREAEERERLRPTYAPLRKVGPIVDQSAKLSHEPWPEPKDDSKLTDEDRRAISYLRLSPPRADDHELLGAYAAIGISEASLRADRNRRHRKRTERLTASYKRLRFDEEVEIEDGEIEDDGYIGNEWQEANQHHIYFDDEEIKDRIAMDDGTIQNERDKARSGSLCVPYQNPSFVEGEMRDRSNIDDKAAQTGHEMGCRMVVDDDDGPESPRDSTYIEKDTPSKEPPESKVRAKIKIEPEEETIGTPNTTGTFLPSTEFWMKEFVATPFLSGTNRQVERSE
ncbi:MAG: hypothetical protein M1840_002851 [Geoglossum simile]|nr:MAG: hypothetical protein M1840_002851 [Geoglossum simile]